MIAFLKNWFARNRARRRGEMGDKPLIDWEKIDFMLERSRIPAVLMLALVWGVASVLLILSWDRQQKPDDWVDEQIAPYNIKAPAIFTYTDLAGAKRKREMARENAPVFFKIDDDLTRNITGNVNDFFTLIERRVADENHGRSPIVSGSLAASLAAKASPVLAEALARECRRNNNYPLFRKRLREILIGGIVGAAPAERKVVKSVGQTTIRIVDGHDRIRRENFILGDFPTVTLAAALLSSTLFPVDTNCRDEFQTLLQQLIGPRGNMNCDFKRTEEEREKAALAVKPEEKTLDEGTILIRKGDRFTPEKRAMIDAAFKAVPKAGFREVLRQMGWSSAIVLAGVFFLFLISTDIRRDNLRILLAGLTVTIALVVNYQAIRIFGYLRSYDILHKEELILSAIPVALVAVMLSILLDCRTAICCSGIAAVITSMMIMPTRSLELALRWVAICSVAALAVRNVTNYRSFFVRTVLSVCGLTLTISLVEVFSLQQGLKLSRELWEALLVILCNGLFCAMAALTLIFIFELLFNLSTNMALMVLCDCNHPLLERLKREAPGTMAHSMAVATLAEDAAPEIGANPLRAKAGALFHDIGKLSMPQYFTENNPDSAQLHQALNPQMSSIIIRDHVKEGLALARQYRLCNFIRGVISSHHGDDLVRFFYQKALEEQQRGGAPVLDSQFRYAGKLPKSREEGIINLADACEAASRSLKSPTNENIAELVHRIIKMRFDDGQLRNSRLTLADLDKLEKSFIATLSGSLHGRVAYPPRTATEGAAKC